jgi:hypothetical protein
VSAVTVDLGDGDDYLAASLIYPTLTVSAGPGDDLIGGGYGGDSLSGGPGDDALTAGPGDSVSGGGGFDAVNFTAAAQLPLSLSLNDLADDGGTANLLSDVEDVSVGWTQTGPVTLVGSAAGNALAGGAGDDAITGAGGRDALDGRAGNDTLDARDGAPDRVTCGPGTDTALVDQYDQVGDSCESVLVSQIANTLEDRAPTLAWEAPAAKVSANRGVTLRVSAGDDRGVASVRFLDDDRVVCTDTVAPFTCAYRPRAEDVGPNTLVAIVSDSAGQTAGVTREVTVARFVPRAVTLAVRDRVARGKVSLPGGVPCAGRVAVRSGRTVRTTALSKTCTYRVAIPAARGAKVRASYEGTDVVAGKRSAARRAR